MDYSIIFAFISVVGWGISSFFWIFAALLPLPINLPDDDGNTGYFRVGNGSPNINGIIMPTVKEIKEYVSKSKYRNGLAAGFSAFSALASALAIYFTYLS